MNFTEFQTAALRTANRTLDAYPQILRDSHQNLLASAIDAETAGGPSAGKWLRISADALLTAWDRMVAVAGLAGEAGEVCDLLKKVSGHGHALDRDKLRSELGDLIWYTAVVAEQHGLTLDECAVSNVAKLERRYPKGFTVDRSVNRE